ncbi:MAG: hypothetical protein EOO16_05960 [Chitinophagaceae bacterium]|nr:MAG: hypothetical protein EOO16_05960 [Chitinophagaceae bacterium]
MKILFVVLLLAAALQAPAQRLFEQYSRRTDSLRIGPDAHLPGQHQGYTVALPDTGMARGVLLFLEEERPDPTKPEVLLHREANAAGWAVVRVSTGIPVDFYFSPASLRFVDTTLRRLWAAHPLPRNNVYLVGAGMSGHRALVFLRYRAKQPQPLFVVRGLVLCESAIDWVRQWYEEKKAVRDNFFPSAVFSGEMVSYLLEQNLKGTPKNRLEAYLQFSGYSYFDERMRHLALLEGLRVRAYSEPATHYWMEQRGKGTFDTNFPDMVGLITELQLRGNKDAELVLFHQDKHLKDRRNPNYTWGLVEKRELMDWIRRGR